jgi:ADP-heptose:LPS heptosyltransferase
MFSSSTVIGVDTKSFIKNLRYRTGILRRVAGIADTAINLALSHDLLWADAIIRVSGARRREGFHGPMDRVGCLGQAIALASYTVLIEPLSDTQFDAESIRQGLLQSGYAVSNLSSPFLHAALPDCVHHVPEGPFFVIAPGSLIPIKKWPAEQFVDLCRWLIDRTGWRCILLGAVGDKVEAAIVAKALPNKVVDLTGKTNLLEAASIIRSSQLVIANDSALVHIAAATGVASAATVGGGHPDRFLPYPKSFTSFRAPQIARHVMECYGCSWKCIFPLRIDQPSPCIAEVSQADMRAAVDRALAASK